MSRFVYQLTIRPAGPHTTPEGAGRDWHDTDVVSGGNGHGSVSYDAPLSLEQIQHYSLLPVTQMRALNGCEFVQRFSGRWLAVEMTHRVSLYNDCQCLKVESTCGNRTKAELLSYADFCHRSKNWLPAPALPIEKETKP